MVDLNKLDVAKEDITRIIGEEYYIETEDDIQNIQGNIIITNDKIQLTFESNECRILASLIYKYIENDDMLYCERLLFRFGGLLGEDAFDYLDNLSRYCIIKDDQVKYVKEHNGIITLLLSCIETSK